jgi:hypothetical protein
MSRTSHRYLFAFIFLFGLTLAPATRAQDLDDVTITGKVADQTGAVVPGATVTVKSATGQERTVSADADGNYRIIDLRPGVYSVRVAEFQGFGAQEKKDLTLIAGQTLQLDFTLAPKGVSAGGEVTIEVDTPLVDTTRTVVGGTVTEQEIEDLPNNTRSPLDLIFTLGGTAEEPLSTRDLADDRNRTTRSTPEEAGIFSLAGGQAYSNNITIEGLDNNDDRGARERFQPPIIALDGVQVVTNQFSGEYGRASGGRVNLGIRPGRDKFVGRATYYFRDEALNANTFRNNQTIVNQTSLKRFPSQEHIPSVFFSGPVVLPKIYNGRQRTFFSASYEFTDVAESTLTDVLLPVGQNLRFPLPAPNGGRNVLEGGSGTSATANVSSFTEFVTTPSRGHKVTARIDHRFNGKQDIAVSYLLERSRDARQRFGSATGSSTRLEEAVVGRVRNSYAILGQYNFLISPRTVNQFRGQYSHLAPALAGVIKTAPVALIAIRSADPSFSIRAGTVVAGNSTTSATDREENRVQLQEVLSHLVGKHTLKFGGDYMRIRSTFIDLADATGTFNFNTAGDFLANRVLRYRHNFNTTSEQTNHYIGVFVQDDWRFRPNMTLALGLRYERESILSDNNNFGPRVAFTYAPKNSSKMVFRFGAGAFYNRVLLRTVDDFTFSQNRILLDTNSIPAGTTRDNVLAQISQAFPNVLTADSPLVQQFGAGQTAFARRFDPDIRIPESYQANVGFEREIGKRFVFEVNYTYNKGVHLWREFNANAPRLPAGFNNFAAYLMSRGFSNLPVNGVRPIINNNNVDTVNYVALVNADGTINGSNTIVVNNTARTATVNLNSASGTASLNAALAAINNLRPDPTRTQVEQLASIGDSKYHGLRLELSRRVTRYKGFGGSFRAVYTLSKLEDDGIVNTSSAVVSGDFNREYGRSTQDRRHRFALSGILDTPKWAGGLRFSPLLRLNSGDVFNVSVGGVDRNLDDVSNDRPNFAGDLSKIVWRKPGGAIDPSLATAFTQPTIGTVGNLPRNAGIGPAFAIFDLRVSRQLRFGERVRVRPEVEFGNVLNHTSFSFGSEFINFGTAGASDPNFLVTTRTYRPRQIRAGLRLEF